MNSYKRYAHYEPLGEPLAICGHKPDVFDLQAGTCPDEVYRVDCPDCVKELNKKVKAEIDFELVDCSTGTGYQVRSAYGVKIDGELVGVIYYSGNRWGVTHVGYDRVKGEKRLAVFQFPRQNSMFEPYYHDRKLDGGFTVTRDGEPRSAQPEFKSKEIAILWMYYNPWKFFALAKLDKLYDEFAAEQDKKAAARREAERQRDQEHEELHEGMKSLWERDDLTNLERAGLRLALDQLMIRIEEKEES